MEICGEKIDLENLNSVYLNCDCMEGMKEFPDKYFDLAVVDPPYGDGGAHSQMRQDSEEMQGDLKDISNPFWTI